MQRGPDEVELRLGLAFMQEEGGFLGGTSGGAFGEKISARSRLLSISLLGSLAEDVDWFTTYSHGRASIDEGERGVFGGWSRYARGILRRRPDHP